MPRIAGIIHPSSFATADLLTLIDAACQAKGECQTLRHRNFALGSWHTPIATNREQTIWALLDGELHNSQALRSELQQLGHTFTTQSHEEILVHAYMAWKEKCLTRLEGPFVLAIFDVQQETLLLARDPLGEKLLYWIAQGNYWLFSTHIRGLLATGVIPQTPSIEGLASYLHFGFVPQDLAMIQGIHALLPGHFLKVDLAQHVHIEQFWSLSGWMSSPHESLSEDEAKKTLQKALDEAVASALPAKGTIGLLSDSGQGSATLNAIVDRYVPSSRVKYYNPVISPETLLNELPKLVWQLDEPLADLQVIRTWMLAQLASQDRACIYTDVGWDDFFGGAYSSSTSHPARPAPSFAFFLAKAPPKVRKLLFALLKLGAPHYKYRILRNLEIDRQQLDYMTESALFRGRSRKKVGPKLFDAFDPEVFTQRFHRISSISGQMSPSLYYDAKTRLPDSDLFQYDRLLSSYDIQVVHPFLHLSLVQFLATLPEGVAPASLLPASPGFSPSPESDLIDAWRTHPLFREAFSLLTQGLLVDEGFISSRWIRQQLGYPYLIEANFRQLWALLVLEIWFRLFINRPVLSIPPSQSTLEILTT